MLWQQLLGKQNDFSIVHTSNAQYLLWNPDKVNTLRPKKYVDCRQGLTFAIQKYKEKRVELKIGVELKQEFHLGVLTLRWFHCIYCHLLQWWQNFTE